MMEVNQGNKTSLFIKSKNTTVFFLGIVFFILSTACKKNKTKEVILTETVPVEYTLYFSSGFRFHKKITNGYDTTVSVIKSFSKHYKVSDKYYPYTNATVTCNNYKVDFLSIDPPNKLSFVSPTCFWKVSDAHLGNLSYDDQRPFPTFSDQNWWNIDSINASEDLIIDFSSFKNYNSIYLHLYNYKTQKEIFETLSSLSGTSFLTLNKSVLAENKGITKISVFVSNNLSTYLNGYSATFDKSIKFEFNAKIF